MVGWRPDEKSRRNWIIAASSVLGIAAAVLFVVLTKDSTPLSGAKPTAENFDVGLTGATPGWFTPDAPGGPVPASVRPQVVGPPFLPQADGRTGGPDGSPTGQGAPDAPQHVPPDSPAGNPPPKPSSTAPPPAQNATAYDTTQGESFDDQSGVKAEPDEKGSGVHIGFISTGDWVRYDNVGFTSTPAKTLQISASNAARQNRTGQVEVRLDSRSNAPVGSLTIANNGDWFKFTTYTMQIQPTTGVHTLYLTFTSNQNEEFANIDWFRFRH